MNGRAASPMAATLKIPGIPVATWSWPVATLFPFFMAMVSAFGTERIDLVARTAYWVLLMALAVVLRQLLGRTPPDRRTNPAFVEAHVIPVAILSLAMTPVVWGANALVLHSPLSLIELAKLLLPVGTVSIALEILIVLEQKGRVKADGSNFMKDTGGLNAFLPISLRSTTIEVLEAEDHYVRVHTAKGATLIRMRFSEAVSRMGNVHGLRSHRSWWVSRDAICDIRREGGRAYLILACGKEVPVSRAVARELGPVALSTLVANPL